MKKRLLALAVTAMVLMAGCSSKYIDNTTNTANATLDFPRFSSHHPDDSIMFSYLIDKRTGVVYLVYYAGQYKIGMTVMLNADGSPVTYDQILSDGGETITELEVGTDGY